jgi:hypothetical protein
MAGDSVGVYDGGQRRLSVFDPGGVLRRDVSFRGLRSANGYQELHGLQDRSLLLGDHEGFGEHRGVFREAVDVWRVSKAGRMEDLLGTFPGWEHFAGQYGHAVAGQVTFGAGFCLASVETGFVVGTTDKPELQLHDASGALTGLVRWPDHDRVVTEERFDSFASAALAAIPEEARAQARKTLDAIPRAEREPAYQTILADDAGRLWVGAYAGASAAFPGTRPPERGWMIFDADGALAARATTPGGFRATAVRGGRLYGIFIDELGVESVRVYPVRGM